jgi:hypothetical protein
VLGPGPPQASPAEARVPVQRASSTDRTAEASKFPEQRASSARSARWTGDPLSEREPAGQ